MINKLTRNSKFLLPAIAISGVISLAISYKDSWGSNACSLIVNPSTYYIEAVLSVLLASLSVVGILLLKRPHIAARILLAAAFIGIFIGLHARFCDVGY